MLSGEAINTNFIVFSMTQLARTKNLQHSRQARHPRGYTLTFT